MVISITMNYNYEVMKLEDLTSILSSDSTSIAFFEKDDCYVNLAGDYEYLTSGYYASQDLEISEKKVHPTCKEVLDSYIVPLFLEKARLSGLLVPEFYITNDYFEPPVIVDTINPFMKRQSIVLKVGHQERVSKSLTRNYTYATCCQELPPGAQVKHFRAVLGWCQAPQYQDHAVNIWKVFRMPLTDVRIITLPKGEVLLSGIKPLPFKSLSKKENKYLDSVVKWLT
jgi:hypothetical protein